MKYRQKPNGMWVVDYLDDQGVRRRVSTGIKTPTQRAPPAEAKSAAREIVLGVRAPRGVPLQQQARKGDGRLTMSDLFDRCWLTIWHPDNVRSQRTIKSNIGLLNGFIGDTAVEDMTFSRVDQLVSDMKARGYQPATIKRKLAMVNKALRMATMWTDEGGKPLLRYKPPMPTVVVSNLKDRIITPVEETALFAALEKRRQLEPNRQWYAYRVFLQVLFDTAGRLGETLKLGPKSLAQNGGVTFLTFPRYQTKSGKPRTVPLAERSVVALGSLMDQLTLHPDSGEWRFFGFKENTASVMLRQLKRDVLDETGMDLADVTLHTIRHTTLTRLAQGGLDLARLQQWAGHSDPKITAERYLHLIPSDLVGGLSILSSPRGTPDATSAGRPANPVIVPSSLSGLKGDSPGTARLQ